MKPVTRDTQRGAVLIIALLFLTILTILGVTAMTATTFEERMAGHARDLNVAFQSAEAALRDARRDLNGIAVGAFAGKRNPGISGKTGFGTADADNGACGTGASFLGLCRPFAYDREKGMQPKFNNVNLVASPSVQYGAYTGAPALVGVSAQPRYFIEVLCYNNFDEGLSGTGTPSTYCNYYRITARGYGGNPNSSVTLQEIFLKTP